jgi:hypothetical protein
MSIDAAHFEAVKISMSQSKDGTVLRLGLHPDDVPPSLYSDWVGSRYMVAMVRLDEQEQPVEMNNRSEIEKIKSSCGALCRNPKFQKWLLLGTDMDVNENNAIHVLKERLEINTRAEFDDNVHARMGFIDMREEFTEWLKGNSSR